MATAQENAAGDAPLRRAGSEPGRIDLVDELLAPDFVDRTPFPGAGASRDVVKDVSRMLRAAFPDHDAVVLDMVAEGGPRRDLQDL